MKIVLYFALAVAAFAATLLGMMAVDGNLNKEGFDRLLGRVDAQAVPKEPETVDPLVRALQQERAKLKEREEKVALREEAVALRERHLEDLLSNIQENVKLFEDYLNQADADRVARLKDDAKTLSSMKPKNAAQAIAEIPNIEDAADTLSYMKDRSRGKVLDEMDPSKAATLLRIMQARPF